MDSEHLDFNEGEDLYMDEFGERIEAGDELDEELADERPSHGRSFGERPEETDHASDEQLMEEAERDYADTDEDEVAEEV